MKKSQTKKCFIIMPSGIGQEYKEGYLEADFVFKQIILPSVKESLGFKDDEIIREVDNFTTGSIGKSIIRNIAYSEYTIADITGLNPNVMFELGIRYSLCPNKTIILVQENNKRVPFDIKDYRYIEYHPFKLDAAKNKLISFLKKSKKIENIIDSPVYDSISSLTVDYPNDLNYNGLEAMSWKFLYNKINEYIEILNDAKSSNIFPDAIIGLSNGGMIITDLISIQFPEIPIFAIWNKRIKSRKKKIETYFSDVISEKQIDSVVSIFNGDEKKNNLLIVDDEVLTGDTFDELFDILNKRIDNINIFFLPLFTRSNKLNIENLDHLLIKNNIFKDFYSKKHGDYTLESMLHTDCKSLPYKIFKVDSHKG